MRHHRSISIRPAAMLLALMVLTGTAPLLLGHCDTLGGPVVKAAIQALESGKVGPVLAWVREQDEAEIIEAFDKTLAVRRLGPKAAELADRYFFETLVRVHRAGEGESFTGLKAAGSEDPAIAAADHAVDRGSIEELTEKIAAAVSAGFRERFERLMEKAKRRDESVGAGRDYVAAYVSFVHYVEAVHLAAAGGGQDAHGGTADHLQHPAPRK